MTGRYALIIGNSHYDDQSLSRLKTPEADVHALATALRDPKVGGFDDVQELLDQNEANVRRAISTFFLKRKSDDQLLLYFSGHGVLDAQGRLFLAMKDTQRELLNATAIASSFVSNEMDACRSKRQILILDCCHSGAFAKGGKGEAPAVTANTFEGNGYGRVVLTASDTTQYALEGDQVIEQASLSLFTNYLLDGLITGEADGAQDGLITLDEWYDYAYDRVVSENRDQTPQKWVYKQEGELIIAKNPNPKKPAPADLPEELKLAIKSPFVSVRTDAVQELKRLLAGSNPVLSQFAYQALMDVASNDDSKLIASTAAAALTAHDPLWHLREPAENEVTVEQARMAELQAEAERQGREAAEAEQRASDAREQAAQAEVDRQAKEQAAKAAAERQAKDQAAKAEALRLETEQQERQKAEAERIARQRAEEERVRLQQEEARQKAQPQEVAYLPFNGELRSQLVKSGETAELVIDVPGGDAKSLTVEFSDPRGELSFSPPSSQITIQPGYNTVVRFRVALRQTPLLSFRGTYPYQARITASSGESQVLTGNVAAPPRLPVWIMAAVALVGIVCLVGGIALVRNSLFGTRNQGAEQTASAEGTLVAIAVQTQSHQGTVTDNEPTLQDTQPTEAPGITPQTPESTLPVVIPTTQVVTTDAPPPPPKVKKLVFASNRDGNWEIYVMEEETGNLTRLTKDPRDDSFPVWSPDGRKILFHSDRNGNFDIFVMNADGSGLQQLTNDSRADTFASWSPNGKQIVFQSKREGPKQIYIMNADGSGQRRLTHSKVDDQFPAWSPDGEWILYSSEIDKVLQLFLIGVDGSQATQLTSGHESYSFPAWSPDGSHIAAAYSTEDKEEIILGRINLRVGAFAVVTGLTAEPGKDTQPRWSPDGKYIYFSTNRNGNFDIYRMDADGSHVIWLSVDPSDEEAPSVYP